MAYRLRARRARNSTKGVPRLPPDKSVEASLAEMGQFAYQYLLAPSLRQQLATTTADHLVVDLDEQLIDIPWELFHDGRSFLCLRFAIGRRILAKERPSASPRIEHSRRRLLVIGNPTGDLPQAHAESKEIARLAASHHVEVTLLSERLAKKNDFLRAFEQYDLIHYAGHGSYNLKNPDESYLSFADGEVRAHEIARFAAGSPPRFVFLNACWSAQELATPASYAAIVRGLSRTFIYSGVGAFIGSILPIPDASAARMAVLLYDGLLGGLSVGEALRIARTTFVHECRPNDSAWATLVLYGDPTTRPLPK